MKICTFTRRLAHLVTISSILPACGSDAVAPSNGLPGGDAGDDGAAAGAAGRSAGGSGTGGRGTGGRASGGASSGGAGGRANTGGSSVDAGTDGNADSGSLSDASTGCTGDVTAVCVDIPGTQAAFLDATGKVLRSGTAPLEHVLPAGGMVLASSGIGPALHLDVPAGTTLRPAVPVTPPVPTDVQDIRIVVPAPPNGQTVLSATACVQPGAALQHVGIGEKIFQMTTACLDGGTAAVHVFASNAYIYVDGITLGAASAAPLTVTLPAWQTVSSPSRFELTSIPAGYEGRVTYRPRWGTGELANTTFGFLTTGGIGTVNITLQPTVGKEWRRFIQIGEGSHNSRTATSVAHASIGHPLPALDSASVVVDLLPIAENIQIAGRTVSWSYPDGGVGAADRVIVNAIGQGTNGDTVLRIMTAPSRTSVTVPASLPGDFAINSLVDVQYATVMAEDFDSVSGYSDSLSHEPPILQFPGSIGDTFGRKSLRSTAP